MCHVLGLSPVDTFRVDADICQEDPGLRSETWGTLRVSSLEGNYLSR
jgi:hypothetical protein